MKIYNLLLLKVYNLLIIDDEYTRNTINQIRDSTQEIANDEEIRDFLRSDTRAEGQFK
jgi:hypothetical protein